jgi:glycosyltransferase involved in cell wall biosynthesis
MLGPVPRAEVARILGRARAVVVPSQWEETFGLVVVEAMAVGTAAIAADHGGPAELVTPGRDGALFPPTETDSLVDLFAEVEDQPARWDGYGRQAYLTYRQRFDARANLDRLLEIYRFAIAHPIETVAKPPVSRGILAALLPRGSNGSAPGEPGTALDGRGQELP